MVFLIKAHLRCLNGGVAALNLPLRRFVTKTLIFFDLENSGSLTDFQFEVLSVFETAGGASALYILPRIFGANRHFVDPMDQVDKMDSKK